MPANQPNAYVSHFIGKLNKAHDIEKQHIADSFHDGLLLLSITLKPLLFNQEAQQYFTQQPDSDSLFDHIEIYSQKRHQTVFDLKEWLLKNRLKPNSDTSPLLWIKTHKKSKQKNKPLIPVVITVHKIQSSQNKTQSLLVLFQDQSLQIQAQAQLKLIEASYAGQFITDPHGFIIQPNYAFSAYTGLSSDKLANMTYIEWLKKQVIFKIPFDSVMQALLEEGCWSGEVKLTPSENTQYISILSLSMLTDSNRNIEHFIGVLQDITDIYEAQSKIERLAYYDNLTGLANRNLLNNSLDSVLRNQNNACHHSGVILIDLDNFKMINDTLGHGIGDKLLISVSKKLQALVSDNELVVRLDGDEFAVFIKETSQDEIEAKTQLLNFAHNIRQALDDRYQIANHSLKISSSIGAYLFNNSLHGTNTDVIMGYSNLAMHEAKNLGGNQVYLFEEKLRDIAKQRLEMLQALNHSELDDEFELYYQAQVNSQGQTIGAETLLRWFHPHLGLVPPNQFIPIAEEGRQIIKIGLWVMNKAFLQAKAWNKTHPKMRISINISPIQFHEHSFVELVIGLVKFTQVNPKNITLELTEGVLIRNIDLALQKIKHLVSLGFDVSIDDFGTGYSSLSYLQKLPIRELKIDQSFIQRIPESEDDIAIIDSIVRLAQTKNLNIVAEGVETQSQADFIHTLNKDILIQGYFYSKPCTATEFETKFLTSIKK
ncbi:EAL domain-containing protein [Thiomicrorhabdus sp.]|uniref:sensor domain-containing protein n=1 Tax=Thiomicrorhabdus sp. TaxID=2039724 RepID=UPI002AA6DC76|nr:EAL domain-containing protein [Thiomicrorhabdus sp.]